MMASSFLLPPGFLKIFLCKLDHVTAQKISFLLGISSANVTKPQETADMVTFTEEILNGKLHFLCSVSCICIISQKKGPNENKRFSSDFSKSKIGKRIDDLHLKLEATILYTQKYVILCVIRYHLYNFKNVKNTHGGVLLLVK